MVLTIRYTTLNLRLQYIIISNFYFIGILVYNSDHEHHLIINAKFHSSRINSAPTMSPANMSAAPQKSYS